ncbi:MAG: YceI family protein [Planctomycetota bacterium]
MSRLMNWIGWLALIGFVGAGVGAWFLTSQRVQFTITTIGAGSPAPDPTLANVEEDLRTVRTDLAALSESLAKNFEALADSLLGPHVVAAPPPSVADSGRASPSSAATESAPAVVADAPAPRRFLSFQLPSNSFDYTTVNRFEVVASLSRVGFDAKSTLHDFTGVTSDVRGNFALSLVDPTRHASGMISAAASQLDTGITGRNDALREHLATPQFPELQFDLQGLTATSVDLERRTLLGNARGLMTIRGKTRDFEIPVRLALDESLRLSVEGNAPLKLSDYEVPVPSQLGLIEMQDEINVWIALKARAVGALSKAAAP